ncbi:MAG: hypothetical protein JSV56_06390 [Methanomassiliicoccales archaeon]|nr:MAG: hypothetical protein JSV56_06390 [Methanomassiliicoccales archaeon]
MLFFTKTKYYEDEIDKRYRVIYTIGPNYKEYYKEYKKLSRKEKKILKKHKKAIEEHLQFSVLELPENILDKPFSEDSVEIKKLKKYEERKQIIVEKYLQRHIEIPESVKNTLRILHNIGDPEILLKGFMKEEVS